jgi:hypothetical protein
LPTQKLSLSLPLLLQLLPRQKHPRKRRRKRRRRNPMMIWYVDYDVIFDLPTALVLTYPVQGFGLFD